MSGTLDTTQYVGSGAHNSGTNSGTTIVVGGSQLLGYDYGAGTATSTTISGGEQVVGDFYGSGTSTDTIIYGGCQAVGEDNGTGTATSTTISNGGLQYVGEDDGIGTAISTTIDGGGQQILAFYGGSGSAASTVIASGGQQILGFNGGSGTATNTTIDSGGSQYVGGYNGTGCATSTTIDGGGYQWVGLDGVGTAIDTTISGGTQYVNDYYGAGGEAIGTTIDSGGSQYVGDSGGTGYAATTIVESGGCQYVGYDDGIGSATSTSLSGGEQVVGSGGTATDTILDSGGWADILFGGVVDAPVIDGGTLQLSEGAFVGTAGIAFAADACSGTLDLGGEGSGATFASNFTAAISGFFGIGGTAATSDIIDVEGTGGTDQVAWTQNGASGTLQVEDVNNTVLESLTLEGTYNQSQFAVTHSGSVDQIAYDADASCFCRGTRILTDRGEVAVEGLAIGDLALTASGKLRPIVWIGRRRIDVSRHPDPAAVSPVRITAGALAPNIPSRDLIVSPEHALGFDGALVPVGDLVNGATIRQEPWSEVEYFHVELDGYDLLVADGAPVESYLDCGSRGHFDDAPDGVVALHPDWRPDDDPRPLAGLARAAEIKARLAARAEHLGRRPELDAFARRQAARKNAPRTNRVRNPRAVGAVAGRIGAGGAVPIFWWCDAPPGIAIDIVGAGVEQDLPFVDIRFSGRAERKGNCSVHPEPGPAIPCAAGEVWTASCHLRRVGGGFAGVAALNLYFDEYGADGAFLDGGPHRLRLPSDDALALQRVFATRRTRRADVRTMTAYLQGVIEAGASIDLTLRIAGMQIEQGAYASDLLLPLPGAFGPTRRDPPKTFAAPRATAEFAASAG